MHPDFVHLAALPRSEPPLSPDLCADRACTTHPTRGRGTGVSAPRPGPHSGRSPRPRPRRPTAPSVDDAEAMAAARAFADRALRLILEVVDRRRSVSTLGTMISPAVTGMVSALSTASVPGRARGAAVVRTVHVRPSGRGAAEVFGTYARGDRVFAVAAHITAPRRPPRRPAEAAAWTVTGLRLS